jgi:hypothetical protein
VRIFKKVVNKLVLKVISSFHTFSTINVLFKIIIYFQRKVESLKASRNEMTQPKNKAVTA